MNAQQIRWAIFGGALLVCILGMLLLFTFGGCGSGSADTRSDTTTRNAGWSNGTVTVSAPPEVIQGIKAESTGVQSAPGGQ